MKFEIFDLNYHYFDTKNVQFGEICSLDSQTEVSYSLWKIKVVLKNGVTSPVRKWIENESVQISRQLFF